MKTTGMMMCSIGLLAFAGSANAALLTGMPLELSEKSDVSVSFVSSSAGATGSLYFLGYQMPEAPMTFATSTDSNDLGMHLMSNHGTTSSFSMEIGTFDANAILHFAYLVTDGVSVAPTGSLFRTDLAADQTYFDVSTFDAETARIGIEDIRDPGQSDWDYNDMIVDVRATPVPTPGATVLALTGGMMVIRRRRRS